MGLDIKYFLVLRCYDTALERSATTVATAAAVAALMVASINNKYSGIRSKGSGFYNSDSSKNISGGSSLASRTKCCILSMPYQYNVSILLMY